MFGFGVLRGLMVTLKHFVETYTEDPKRIKARALTPDAVRQTPNDSKGLFTVQYPEEKLAIPERFRFYPMLIVDADTGQDWCTSCGICAKVCPPQCIWIVRGTKPDGKPKPEPEEFYIDTTICMQCGYCAEFCPFDAIKMNHDYELSTYERHESAIYNKDILSVTTTYYARTHPRAWAEEAAARDAKESKKTGGGAAAETPRAAPAPVAAAPASSAPAAAPAAPGAKPKPIPARLAKQMRQQEAGEAGHEAGHAPAAETPTASAAPTPPAAPTSPAAPTMPAAPAGSTTGETLPSGRPKPIPARLAKQMREQAAQQGGASVVPSEAPHAAAPAAPATTTSPETAEPMREEAARSGETPAEPATVSPQAVAPVTSALVEAPEPPSIPPLAAAETPSRIVGSSEETLASPTQLVPTASTASVMTSFTETTEQRGEEAAQPGGTLVGASSEVSALAAAESFTAPGTPPLPEMETSSAVTPSTGTPPSAPVTAIVPSRDETGPDAQQAPLSAPASRGTGEPAAPSGGMPAAPTSGPVQVAHVEVHAAQSAEAASGTPQAAAAPAPVIPATVETPESPAGPPAVAGVIPVGVASASGEAPTGPARSAPTTSTAPAMPSSVEMAQPMREQATQQAEAHVEAASETLAAVAPTVERPSITPTASVETPATPAPAVFSSPTLLAPSVTSSPETAQQVGAHALGSTDASATTPAETPTAPGIPPMPAAVTPVSSIPTAPVETTTGLVPSTSAIPVPSEVAASSQDIGSHGAGSPSIIPNPRETAETRLAADQAALEGAVDVPPVPSRSQPSEEAAIGAIREPGVEFSQSEMSAPVSQPGAVVAPPTPVPPEMPTTARDVTEASAIAPTPIPPETPTAAQSARPEVEARVSPPVSTEWQGGKPAWVGSDDLTIIEGIGPKIAGLFHAAGIRTFRQLSEMSTDQMQRILTEAGPRFRTADPTTWAEQARLAAAGEWEALKRLQDRLSGGRSRG
ncbi:MAG: 4Fe-4S binding protein [Anaerolineae bacterium]|nr:4Fe-4S binding protein [Anaerolineae bacterium]